MNYRFSMRDHMDEAASVVGVEGWQAYRWEVVEGGAIVSGCVPCGVFTRGPRKGQPKFKPSVPGTDKRVAIADAQMNIVAAAYEKETGVCWDCKGSGETWAGWSVDTGARYRECTRCKGTKLAPRAEDQP